MTFATKTTILFATRGKTSHLTVFVHTGDDPVYSRVSSHCFVGRVHKYNLKEFVDSIATNPVGIQHPQITTATTSTLLSNRSQVTVELEELDTFVGVNEHG
jgi:hypothetical protein